MNIVKYGLQRENILQKPKNKKLTKENMLSLKNKTMPSLSASSGKLFDPC